MSFFSRNKIITINGSKNYFRFFVSSMPIFALLLLVINLFGFVISNEISFKLHDRDIASSMSISGALLETFGTESTLEQTVYKDQVKSIVRQFAKSSGVSCVELSWEGHSIMYPPQNFCANLVIRDKKKLTLSSGQVLTYHLNNTFLRDIKNGSRIYNSVFSISTFLIFVFFNYLGYLRVTKAKLAELLDDHSVLINSSPIPIARLNSMGQVISSSESWNNYFKDKNFQSELPVESHNLFQENVTKLLLGNKTFLDFEFQISDPILKFRKIRGRITKADAANEEYFLACVDIDAISRVLDERTHQARQDVLTGAKSRRALYEDFNTKNLNGGVLFCLLDIDHFKYINDSFGHHMGDIFLQTLARSVLNFKSISFDFYRLGGEEFLLISKLKQDKDYFDQLLNSIGQIKVDVDSTTIRRTISSGLSHAEDGEDISEILKRCDLMLGHAKTHGRDQIVYYDQSNTFQYDDYTNDEILHAMGKGEIKLYLQPIYSLQFRKVIGCESLLRWEHSEAGLLMPSAFLSSYYKGTGSSTKSCARHSLFVQSINNLPYTENFTVTYNINYEDVLGQNIDILLKELSSLTSKSKIVLELSEIAFLAKMDINNLSSIVKKLRHGGYLIALDDFGKESSNLQRLVSLDVDIVKIDMSLITNIGLSLKKREVVRAIKNMCDVLSIEVIAEGVETEVDKKVLFEIGIDKCQGFLFSKALPLEKFISKNLV